MGWRVCSGSSTGEVFVVGFFFLLGFVFVLTYLVPAILSYLISQPTKSTGTPKCLPAPPTSGRGPILVAFSSPVILCWWELVEGISWHDWADLASSFVAFLIARLAGMEAVSMLCLQAATAALILRLLALAKVSFAGKLRVSFALSRFRLGFSARA